ncbi:unnamed protein product [Urochloa humidicola]
MTTHQGASDDMDSIAGPPTAAPVAAAAAGGVLTAGSIATVAGTLSSARLPAVRLRRVGLGRRRQGNARRRPGRAALAAGHGVPHGAAGFGDEGGAGELSREPSCDCASRSVGPGRGDHGVRRRHERFRDRECHGCVGDRDPGVCRAGADPAQRGQVADWLGEAEVVSEAVDHWIFGRQGAGPSSSCSCGTGPGEEANVEQAASVAEVVSEAVDHYWILGRQGAGPSSLRCGRCCPEMCV